jgi:hypothetical protein
MAVNALKPLPYGPGNPMDWSEPRDVTSPEFQAEAKRQAALLADTLDPDAEAWDAFVAAMHEEDGFGD